MRTLPVRHDGRLDYAALARELRVRLLRCGLAHYSAQEQYVRIQQAYWGRVVRWMVMLVAMGLVGWVLAR